MDGKTWTAYTGEGEPEAAFVRVNNTRETIALGVDALTWALKPIAEFAGASCSVELYQPANYPLSNLTDGDYSTKIWTNGAQNEGQTVTLEYTDLINVNAVKLVFGDGDRAKEPL